MVRVGFCVSGRGAAVRAAIKAARTSLLDIEPAVVVCDRPSPIIDLAREAGITAHEHVFDQFDQRADFDAAVEESLRGAGCDWLMLNYNRLIPKSTIDLVAGRALNLHMSLLPLFTGFGALKKALASGMKIAGVTIHLVDDSIDAGRIIGQAAAPILPQDDEQSLGRRLFEIALPLQLQILREASLGRIDLRDGELANRAAFDPAGSFAPSIDDDLRSFARAYCADAL